MAPKKRSKQEEAPTSSLVAALQFVKCCQMQTSDQPHQVHCRIGNGKITAFDGVVAAGFPIEEDLAACPHTYKLSAAFKRAKGAISITKQDQGFIAIKSAKFRAVVPCVNPSSILNAEPDLPQGVINDRIRTGFGLLNNAITIGGARVMDSSVFLRANTMSVTDGIIVIQYWHGIDLPNNLIVPKQFVNAVCKNPMKLTHIGTSRTSITFYYANGSWMKTQLYAEGWIDVDKILNLSENNAQPIPDGFFTGVEALSDFGDILYTDADLICSEKDRNIGASYEVKGITPGLCLSTKRLAMIKHMATNVDFIGNGKIMFFYGNQLRGAIAHMS